MSRVDKILLIMIIIRLSSSMIELGAACLMLYFKSIATAIRINAVLGLIGPLVLILVTFVGLVGLSSQLNLQKLLLIAAGVCLILLGTR